MLYLNWLASVWDEILGKYAGSLHENSINHKYITQYKNSLKKYKSGKISQVKSITSSIFIFYSNLSLSSFYIECDKVNLTIITKAS